MDEADELFPVSQASKLTPSESDSAGIHKPGKQASLRLEMEDGVHALL